MEGKIKHKTMPLFCTSDIIEQKQNLIADHTSLHYLSSDNNPIMGNNPSGGSYAWSDCSSKYSSIMIMRV